MKCPWCNEWEGPPAKYSDHLKYCKKYPPNYEAMKEQARVRPIEASRPPEEREKLKRWIDEDLSKMITDEIQAQKDYTEIESALRDLGYPTEADKIAKIQKDEAEHMNILNEVKGHVRLLSYAY